MKRIDPLFKKVNEEDMAFNCNCYCNVEHDLHSEGKSWTWLPWNTCGCGCYGTDNSKGNSAVAEA